MASLLGWGRKKDFPKSQGWAAQAPARPAYQPPNFQGARYGVLANPEAQRQFIQSIQPTQFNLPSAIRTSVADTFTKPEAWQRAPKLNIGSFRGSGLLEDFINSPFKIGQGGVEVGQGQYKRGLGNILAGAIEGPLGLLPVGRVAQASARGGRLLPKIALGLKQGAKEGGVYGGLYGAGQAASQDASARDIIKSGLASGGIGIVGGGALGAALPIAGAGIRAGVRSLDNSVRPVYADYSPALPPEPPKTPLTPDNIPLEAGKGSGRQLPILGPELSQRASRTSATRQAGSQTPLVPESQVGLVSSYPQNTPPRTKTQLNTERLNLEKSAKEALDMETKQTLDSLSNKEVQRIARDAGLDTRTYTVDQTKKRIAQQLNTRQNVVSLMEAAEQARQAGDNIKAGDFLKQAAEQGRISVSQGSDVARQLQARKIIANVLDTPQQKIFKLLDTAGVNPDVYAKRLASVDFNNPNEVVSAYRDLVPAKARDWVDKYRYTNMLSSPLTHIVNITSNIQGIGGVAPAQKLFEGGVDAARSLITGKPRTRFAGEAGAYLKGVKQSIPEAVQRFRDVMSNKALMENPDFDIARNAPLGTKGLSGFADKVFTVIPKLLEASDQFGTTLAKGGETRALLKRQAKGVDVGTAGQVALKADDAATYRLFRQKLGKEGQGHVLDAIDTIPKIVQQWRSSKNPIVRNISKYTFPFIATPTNLFKQGIEYSPFGVSTVAGSADKTAQIAKTLMGTSVMALTTGVLAAKGDITFNEPTSAKERDAFRAEGKQPYAVKIGGKWYGYSKLHPAISFNLATVAATKDALDKGSIDQSTADKVLSSAAGVMGYFRDQSYMKNVGDFTSIMQSKDGASLGDIAANQATNTANQLVPFKSMTSWIGRQVDPTQRKVDYDKSTPEQIYQGIVRDIPKLNSAVPTRTNPYTGEPLTNDNPILNSWSPVRVTNDRGFGNTTGLTVNQREQIRDLPTTDKEPFRRGIIEEKAAKKKERDEIEGFKKSTGDTKQLSNGRISVKVGDEYRTVDSQAEADKAIAKDKFDKSGKNYEVIGNTVFRRSPEGNISTVSKAKFDYQLGSASLTQQKRAGNLEGWFKTANSQLQSIQKQLLDPSIDPIEALTLQNQAQTLRDSMAKYKSYGGFTRPKKGKTAKKGRKGRKGGAAKTEALVSSFKTAAIKAPKLPKITVRKPVAFKAPSTRKLSVSRIPSSATTRRLS